MSVSMLSIRLTLVVFAIASVGLGCSRRPADSYEGYVEGKFVYVATPQSGRLTRLSVSRGDDVAVSHPLFSLDREPEAAAERQAAQLVRVSEARLADLQTGKRPPEIDVIRAQLAQAQSELQKTVDLLKSYEKQYTAGGMSETDLISARAAVATNNALVRQFQSDLVVAALPSREQQIRAQAEQVAADRAALQQATWKLQQKEIASPRNGLVFDTLYREGEWVPSGSPIVQLLPPENLEVRFFVPETLIGKLKLSQDISVRCDGCSSSVPATITFISTQVEYTPPVIYSNENRSKLVFMVIAKPPLDKVAMLHPGQPVEVTLR
ncbi:MAG TPA: HlyD family efflux transporter periplasmic adaptor subunit [Candidatus Eisenbacteria bacterium]|nr:HlyD family efflux transporter periplasmic adaptor subunit [Candidatus Eisenbacteria bacterium]